MTRTEYVSRWHTLFTTYVNTTLEIIAARIAFVEDAGNDRLRDLEFMLEGPDVCDVKSDLSCGIVSDSTLDKTEKIYAEIDKFFIDIAIRDDKDKEILKQLADIFEHYRKEMTKLELRVLK